jgi:hypothetical protein
MTDATLPVGGRLDHICLTQWLVAGSAPVQRFARAPARDRATGVENPVRQHAVSHQPVDVLGTHMQTYTVAASYDPTRMLVAALHAVLVGLRCGTFGTLSGADMPALVNMNTDPTICPCTCDMVSKFGLHRHA